MSRRRIAVGALLAAVFVTLAIVLTSGEKGYVVRAQFADAAGLRNGFTVKVGGVPVGRVESVGLDRSDRAVAVLKLDKSAAPIGRDARTAIRPSNLLGEKFVDLHPGDTSRPAPSGTTITPAHTATPPELDDLLDVLDEDTRTALGVFLAEQGTALAGRGHDLATALVRMPPALDEGQKLLAGLGRDNKAVGRLEEESDRILSSVARERSSLGSLVATAGGALDTLASRRQQLGDTIRRAPGALVETRRSLVELERASVPLIPAARGLRATAPPLTETLRALPGFVAAAEPTLRTAQAVAPSLDRLGRDVTPVVRRLQPAASKLNEFGGAFDPVTEIFDQAAPDLFGTIEGWARAIQDRDAAGHVYRVTSQYGGDAIDKLRRDFIIGSTAKRHTGGRQPGRVPLPELGPVPHLPDLPKPKVPLPKLPAPPLPRVPTPDLPQPNGPVLDLPKPHLPGVGARTSRASRSPLAALLDYLMGN